MLVCEAKCASSSGASSSAAANVLPSVAPAASAGKQTPAARKKMYHGERSYYGCGPGAGTVFHIAPEMRWTAWVDDAEGKPMQVGHTRSKMCLKWCRVPGCLHGSEDCGARAEAMKTLRAFLASRAGASPHDLKMDS